MLATGRFPHISALFEGRSEKQSAALFTSTTEDDRFELGLAAILDRFDPRVRGPVEAKTMPSGNRERSGEFRPRPSASLGV